MISYNFSYDDQHRCGKNICESEIFFFVHQQHWIEMGKNLSNQSNKNNLDVYVIHSIYDNNIPIIASLNNKTCLSTGGG